ncbi:hypothetical protein SAMN06295900_10772 [Trinickia caryophylli]|uniref:Uncharacterized protein n=1 Tax=Trinickia caryophylli TaxID=28094 RepID=A0A1X7F2W3_TRICW|nr:hypothetical protein SAMN06295900_10772 [Trinickia caryophylli]
MPRGKGRRNGMHSAPARLGRRRTFGVPSQVAEIVALMAGHGGHHGLSVPGLGT